MDRKQVEEIKEGFTNLGKSLVGVQLEDNVAKIAEYRYGICLECPYRRPLSNTCAKCGCFLPAKTKSMKSKCPLNKWAAER